MGHCDTASLVLSLAERLLSRGEVHVLCGGGHGGTWTGLDPGGESSVDGIADSGRQRIRALWILRAVRKVVLDPGAAGLRRRVVSRRKPARGGRRGGRVLCGGAAAVAARQTRFATIVISTFPCSAVQPRQLLLAPSAAFPNAAR